MARFPVTESEVVTLAQKVIAGLQAHGTVYPTPPVEAETLEGVLQNYITKQNAANSAQAAAAQAVNAKLEAFRLLTENIKSDLRYAENTVKDDDIKLKMLGWGGKAARTALEPPGQPGTLETARRDTTGITLFWKEPKDGGKVAVYTIERRERSTGPWLKIETTFTTQATLKNQPRGSEIEYRVVAMNKAGEGEPSNTLEAIF